MKNRDTEIYVVHPLTVMGYVHGTKTPNNSSTKNSRYKRDYKNSGTLSVSQKTPKNYNPHYFLSFSILGTLS